MASPEEFVAKLKIARPPQLHLQRFLSYSAKAGAEVASPSQTDAEIIRQGVLPPSFNDEISSKTRNDILNSTLFAQLAADKVFNRDENFDLWCAKYMEVLSKIGWIFQDFSPSGFYYCFDLEILFFENSQSGKRNKNAYSKFREAIVAKLIEEAKARIDHPDIDDVDHSKINN